MTEAQTVSSEVEVAVDPATAFQAFTEEMDLWWVRGPINFWSDGGRVVEVRCEPGVGGRIIEVLDDPASGEVLERARLTQWEPGVRLGVGERARRRPDRGALRADRRRDPRDGRALHPRRRGGPGRNRVESCRARAGSARGARCATGCPTSRSTSPGCRWACPTPGRPPPRAGSPTCSGSVPAAIFPRDPTRSPKASTATRGSSSGSGTRCLNVFKLDGERSGDAPTHVPWVYVDDLEAHFAHAKGSGATIVEEIHAYPGSTVYVADDLEGNRWTFSQARPTMR